MKTSPVISLAEQRLHLRQQLLAQRELIAQKMASAPGNHNGYPRSMTMRLLSQRPTLVLKLITGITTLLLGARMISAIGTTLSLAKVVQSVAKNRTDKKSAPVTCSPPDVNAA